MKIIVGALTACLLAGGCSFYLGKAAATRSSDAPAVESPAARSASHDQTCSELRADIASSQHNQRNAPPASNAPIIAAASEGKEDQRIAALQQRYDEMGCVANPAAASQP